MSPLDHVDDYPEIPVSLGSTRTALKTGQWRSVRPVLVTRRSPCAAACPAGVEIPEWIHHVEEGRIEEAFRVFTERNPFPRITGRICPHHCEDDCSLGVVTSEGPVSIRALERWLGDATAGVPHPLPHPPTRRRVAIVGSGPAGLAAAYYLRRSGHGVAVIERRQKAGGMLRNAIPEYRLPAAVVDHEIGRLEAMGVVIHRGIEIGREVTLDELASDYSAVFVATGASRERDLDIPGAHLLTPGLRFLETLRAGGGEIPDARCAVVGGGNTAMDVARVLRRLGARVTVLYRRTADEMPAIREEYEAAVAEGVEFEFLTLPRSLERLAGGIGVTVEQMDLGAPDGSGRRRPEPTGAFRTIQFDAVFSAIGEVADLAPFPDRFVGDDRWLSAGEGGATAYPGVFAGGDVVTGPATVVEAIAAGRSAAREIDRRLGFGDRWPVDPALGTVDPWEVHTASWHRSPRVADSRMGDAGPFDEETATISVRAARSEIERCLACGHCNACGTCLVFCPDAAISWADGPVVDLEFCKGCGICAAECPGHSFVMVEEREASHA